MATFEKSAKFLGRNVERYNIAELRSRPNDLIQNYLTLYRLIKRRQVSAAKPVEKCREASG